MKNPMKKAIVTFTIGEKYNLYFNKYFEKSILKYCLKYNYDFIRLTEPLDPNVHFNTRANGILIQKLLVATQDWSHEYDYIVWIDSDIYITDSAEDICSFIDLSENKQKIFMCNQSAQINKRMRLFNQLTRGFELNAQTWYRDRGIIDGIIDNNSKYDDVGQSGVIVFQPSIHAAICQEIYNSTITNPHYQRHGEDQPFISYELLKRNMLEFLPWEFNAVWELHANMFIIPSSTNNRLQKETLGRLMFISHFIHFTSMNGVDLIADAEQICFGFTKQLIQQKLIQ